jgi:hypothetical protein
MGAIAEKVSGHKSRIHIRKGTFFSLFKTKAGRPTVTGDVCQTKIASTSFGHKKGTSRLASRANDK